MRRFPPTTAMPLACRPDAGRRAFVRGIGVMVLAGVCGVSRARAAPLAEVTIVLSENTSLYAEASQALIQELGPDVRVSVIVADALEAPGRVALGGAAIVALGTRALGNTIASEPQAPVVAVLVPRRAYDVCLGSGKLPAKGITAVFLDQPYARQLNLTRLMLPNKTRIGILVGPEWENQVATLTSAAREQKLTLVREPVLDPRDLHLALQKVISESDVILALPDSSVFNSATLPNILLTSYRRQLPVFGFSPAYVRAGALAAVFSTPQQNAKQAAELVLRAVGGGAMPQPQYPRTFWVSVNGTVARSLDLKVEDEATLVAELQRLEREP